MKRYFITSVSNVDPFTVVEYKYIVKSEKDAVENSQYSDTLYLDGSMLSIIRKYLSKNEGFTDIYIYLTDEMNKYRNKYLQAIKFLYNGKDVNVKFYPTDEKDLRKDDVHKFSSFYKEIYDMYKDIRNNNPDDKKPEIVANISSGTPAFKSDIMLMAVTNNLIIEQTANITEDNTKKLRDYASKNDEKYKALEKEKLKIKITSNSKFLLFDKISDSDFEIMLQKLNDTEDSIDSRTQTEKIKEIKKIMLLESVEDSVLKKDYAGIYHSILENKEYLSQNKEELLKIAKNLYYRYIGNNEDDFAIDEKSVNMNEIKEYYPIFDIKFEDSNNFEKKKNLNYIIEKFNIMKVKVKRDEINDFLLISTPLLEAISKEISSKYSGIDFEKILEKKQNNITNNKKEINAKYAISSKNNQVENNKKEINVRYVISSKKFEELYRNKFSSNMMEKVKQSDGHPLNAFFYKNILFALKKEGTYQEKEEIEKVLDKIFIIDIARDDRVDAAHSIKNVNKEEFESDYSQRLELHSRANRLIKIKNDLKCENNIYLIESQFKELIKLLLPKCSNDNTNEEILEKSLNVYETLENRILQLLKDEIYELEGQANE